MRRAASQGGEHGTPFALYEQAVGAALRYRLAAGDKPRDASSDRGMSQQARGNLARCDSMQGAQKDQCMRDERAKLGSRVEQSKAENKPAERQANRGTGNTPRQ